MKCPIDKTEMEKGALYNHGANWLKQGPLLWTGTKVYAYKCPKCGKIELTTEVK